jgi:hypothetical protein
MTWHLKHIILLGRIYRIWSVKLAGNFKHSAFSPKFFEDTSSAVGRQGDIRNSIAN